MLITKFFADNLYSFDNAELDLTIQREPKRSIIDAEYLEERPKFRFKRVCILSGANATGKTNLGRLMHSVQHFVVSHEIEPMATYLKKIVSDASKKASVQLEYVTPIDNKLHLLEIILLPENTSKALLIKYRAILIPKNATAQASRKKLLSIDSTDVSSKQNKIYIEANPQQDDITYLSKVIEIWNQNKSDTALFGWRYYLSHTINKQEIQKSDIKINVLQNILTTFDSSIEEVTEIFTKQGKDKEPTGFLIKFSNSHQVILDIAGEMTNGSMERLSKGTYEAIHVANFVSRVFSDRDYIQSKNNTISLTYYLDESMAFSHTELEIAVVNLIVQKLPRFAQFFYTTHNHDILEMAYPTHTYAFLAKKRDGKTHFIQPEHLFKRNDRQLINYVKNNVFHTLPKTTGIDKLLDY
ncbi:AAA family ATPase [Basilea psittacipulmonis]|uniref:ATPase AAA-type core domain-containing protein n=1 Tax=Basilea psittacipulmonis DSM 24701 TaxID=1072685 RepID=A0A077DE31_9BURK|nr:hypothetical protein [Basilea psittacipulmonis]AIL32396.1 hypothetical protein IX83_02880 [Basilea psittacipulmonis DSM 24701]